MSETDNQKKEKTPVPSAELLQVKVDKIILSKYSANLKICAQLQTSSFIDLRKRKLVQPKLHVMCTYDHCRGANTNQR